RLEQIHMGANTPYFRGAWRYSRSNTFRATRRQLRRDPALSTTPGARTEVHLFDHRLRTDVGIGNHGQDPAGLHIPAAELCARGIHGFLLTARFDRRG